MKGREFKRVWGQPWDYSYLLSIEQRKLKEMAAYFKKSQLTVGWEFQVRDCELCVKLLDIILEKDKDYRAWLNTNYGEQARKSEMVGKKPFHKHINLKNLKRFFPQVNLDETNPNLLNSFMVEVRIQKAFHLYHKIRLYRMMHWWD